MILKTTDKIIALQIFLFIIIKKEIVLNNLFKNYNLPCRNGYNTKDRKKSKE
jgi:hypothetical protein